MDRTLGHVCTYRGAGIRTQLLCRADVVHQRGRRDGEGAGPAGGRSGIRTVLLCRAGHAVCIEIRDRWRRDKRLHWRGGVVVVITSFWCRRGWWWMHPSP
ncbi:hypothetical protein VPH35_078301 [Triticum aestivum]|uniref:Uncharacterized protein n=1 Tax=Aegilops tauschii subsp. strangulata TaxID=200361 RepID=A0A453I8H8_AEGTS